MTALVMVSIADTLLFVLLAMYAKGVAVAVPIQQNVATTNTAARISDVSS